MFSSHVIMLLKIASMLLKSMLLKICLVACKSTYWLIFFLSSIVIPFSITTLKFDSRTVTSFSWSNRNEMLARMHLIIIPFQRWETQTALLISWFPNDWLTFRLNTNRESLCTLRTQYARALLITYPITIRIPDDPETVSRIILSALREIVRQYLPYV